MSILTIPVDGYEEVVRFSESDGFTAFVAVHSTQLGPAIGGCRIFPYANEAAAMNDVLALAEGMTLKNSLAGLDNGGAKMVVIADKANPALMIQIGKCIEYFNGRYISAEDVGTTVEDMRIAAQYTGHIATLGSSGDPSPWTALGVFECMEVALEHIGLGTFGTRPDIPVWVQGLGKVGWDLFARLHHANAKIYVSDLREDIVQQAKTAFGVEVFDPNFMDRIEIYAPCAMGQVITNDNIDKINFSIICGSANNQLSDPNLAEILMKRGTLYCPDFLVNAGGVLNVAAGIGVYDREKLFKRVVAIGEVFEHILGIAEYLSITPLEASMGLARARLC